MPPLERFLFTLNRQNCFLLGKFFGLLGIRRSTFLEKVYDLPGIRERNGIGVELHSFEKALGSLVQRKFFLLRIGRIALRYFWNSQERFMSTLNSQSELVSFGKCWFTKNCMQTDCVTFRKAFGLLGIGRIALVFSTEREIIFSFWKRFGNSKYPYLNSLEPSIL